MGLIFFKPKLQTIPVIASRVVRNFLLTPSIFIESPMENEPKIGEIIAAKEKTGTKFYRAEVISKFDNEHFNVCFIDFGTRELVHKNNIVQPSELQVKIFILPN